MASLLSGTIKSSKISGGGVTQADTGTVTSQMILDGTIVNADINASAAIDPTKIAGTAVITTDSRLSDVRTPTAHAATHGTAGSDPVTIAPSQVTGTAVVTSDARLSDTRTPTDASVTDAKIATTLSPSKITGTAVVTSDSRLSDTRTPTDATVTNAKIASAGLAQSSLTSNVIADWAASTTYARNDLVNYLGVAYRRISAGTSSATFDSANWNAQTPALSAIAANITSIPKASITGTAVTLADTGTVTSTMILDGTIANADIAPGAGILDTKLATISTALKVSNSATTATDANTASAIVARDASGNFTAGTITAYLTGNVSGSSGSTTGNAATATALQTARTINGVSFNGTANITVADSDQSIIAMQVFG